MGNDDEVGNCLGFPASQTGHSGPARRSRRDRTDVDEIFQDHFLSIRLEVDTGMI
jgi:hypothetical protein